MGFSAYTWIAYSVLVIIVTLSAIIDYKLHRIPNWLSFSGWCLGPIFHYLIAGFPALSASLTGMLLVLLLTFPLFVLNWMGAGDVKLMTAVGAMTGIDHALLFLASIVAAGFVIGIAQLVLRGVLLPYIRRYMAMVGFSFASGRPVYVSPDSEQQQVIMPYAISIAAGTFVAIYLLWM